MCGCLSRGPHCRGEGGDPACNPGMWPYWELNWRPFGSQPELSPLSHTSQVPVLHSCSAYCVPGPGPEGTGFAQSLLSQ